MRAPVPLAAALLAGAGCGADAPSPAATKGLAVAFALPRVVALGVVSSGNLCVEAVYQATILSGGAQSGRIVSTGTLQVGQFGPQYSPAPADRLVVTIGGKTHEFVLKDAQGNMQAESAGQWLAAPHVLEYSHKMGSDAEATIRNRFDGSRFDVSVEGWYTQAGTRYDVKLTAAGGAAGERDATGADTRTGYDLRGTIRAPDIEVDVDERHATTFASAMGLDRLPSQRGSASRFEATIRNVLRASGAEYRFDQVRVQADSRTKGNDTTSGVTGLEGAVLRDGAPFGRCVLAGERAMLVTDAGPIALDSVQ